MKSKQLWHLTSLLLSASYSVRQLFGKKASDLPGARVDLLGLRDVSSYDTKGHREPHFIVDALIHPASPEEAWQPGALRPLPSDAAATLIERDEEAGGLCRVLGVEVVENGGFQAAGDRVCIGKRRVRLRLRVRPELAPLCFRHGSALFGSVVLPGAALLAA